MVSFVTKAQEIITRLASRTDAETSLTFTSTTYTRDNPWEAPTASSDTEVTATGFVFPPGTRRWNGEMVEANERVVYVAVSDLSGITLGVDTTVTVDSKTFSTEKFNAFPEGDNPALYEIFIGLG